MSTTFAFVLGGALGVVASMIGMTATALLDRILHPKRTIEMPEKEWVDVDRELLPLPFDEGVSFRGVSLEPEKSEILDSSAVARIFDVPPELLEPPVSLPEQHEDDEGLPILTVRLDDWGPDFDDPAAGIPRWRWTVWLGTPSEEEIARVRDGAKVIGINLPLMLGNAESRYDATAAAHQWIDHAFGPATVNVNLGEVPF